MKQKILYVLGLGNLILVLTGFGDFNVFNHPEYYIILSPIISLVLIITSIIFNIKRAIWLPAISLILSIFLFTILASTPW